MESNRQAGRELDVEVGTTLGKTGWELSLEFLPHYSTTWEGMRLVVEALAAEDLFITIRKYKNSVSCLIKNNMGGIVAEVHDIETEPNAVCLAALEADTHE